MRRELGWLGLGGAPVLGALIACGWAPGDRLATYGCPDGGSCGSTCPAGETCSSEVPGLELIHSGGCGPGYPAPVAVGGTETIHTRPWRDDWSVASSSEAVFRAELVEREVRPGMVTHDIVVRGAAPGTAYLRVLDSDGALVERLAFEVVVPTASDPLAGWRRYGWSPVPTLEPYVVPEHELEVLPGLVDARGRFVADDEATRLGDLRCGELLEIPEAGVESGFETAAGRFLSRTELRSTVDDLALVGTLGPGPTVLPYAPGETICFEGRLGGRTVIGFVPEIRIDGALVGATVVDLWFVCTWLPDPDTGREVIVEARAGDVTRAFAVPVVGHDGSEPLLASGDGLAPSPWMAGDRLRAETER